jgi:O-antigen/teichoic acid export membrane protein
MLRRIFKMLMAQGANVCVIMVTQLVLPPVFLYAYGVARYGEWLVLSATIAYLTTLNFGVTTYASNELTMMRQRGDLKEYQRLQASTLAMILGMMCIGALVSALVAAVPLNTLLHLTHVSRREASFTAFFLGMQIVAHLLGGYYNNLFMVVQESHRGTMWLFVRRFAGSMAAVPLALMHLSFATVAFGQFAATMLIALITVVDLRRRMKGQHLPLGLRGANWATAKSTMKPSGMFGMIFMQSFLLFQVPVILLQRLLGPEIVVLFATSRTVLSIARQGLSIITIAIAPEITFSFGSGNRKKLLDIFHYSERVVFSVIPVANLGTFLFSPFLIVMWLHRPRLFDMWTYALMALISGVMSMREHKQYFQFSTNTHRGLAYIVFWGNVLMIGVSIPMTMWLGMRGFMFTWLASESTQMALLYFENRKLFSSDPSISMVPVLKLGIFMAVALPPCMWLVNYTHRHSRMDQVSVAMAGTIVLFGASYWIFGLNLVRQRLFSRYAARRKPDFVV